MKVIEENSNNLRCLNDCLQFWAPLREPCCDDEGGNEQENGHYDVDDAGKNVQQPKHAEKNII